MFFFQVFSRRYRCTISYQYVCKKTRMPDRQHVSDVTDPLLKGLHLHVSVSQSLVSSHISCSTGHVIIAVFHLMLLHHLTVHLSAHVLIYILLQFFPPSLCPSEHLLVLPLRLHLVPIQKNMQPYITRCKSRFVLMIAIYN